MKTIDLADCTCKSDPKVFSPARTHAFSRTHAHRQTDIMKVKEWKERGKIGVREDEKDREKDR